jgi:trk system potassium uptake protein
MKIAVIGLGEFGMELVKCLHKEDHEVVAIDINMHLIDEIKNDCTSAICLDATDEAVMKEQGFENFDYVILAVADNFETLIVTADILKKLEVKRIFARYQSPLQVKILNMLGITKTFNPEEEAAKNMAESLAHYNLRGTIKVSEQYSIIEMLVPKDFINKKLVEVNIKEKYCLLLLTIKKPKKDSSNINYSNNTDYLVPREPIGIPLADTVFEKGDIMVLFGHQSNTDKILEDYE